MTRGDDAREFWDEKAREDAFFFVDSRLRYKDPDKERFWADGERDLDTLLDLAGARLAADDSVVEIGCGIGRLTRGIAARAGDVRAVDVAPEMLRLAGRYNGGLDNVNWIEGDGVSLAGIASESADACISHVVFQHLPAEEMTLGYVREIGRVLRSGGWAAFQVSNDPSVHAQRPGLRERIIAVFRRSPRGLTHRNWVGSHVDLENLRAVAEEAGTRVAKVANEGTQYCVVRLEKR